VSPTFHSLRIRNYRVYAGGAVISNVGTWMQRVAQDWMVLKLTDNSATALGIVTGLQFLPMLLMSPAAGLVADRFAKRKVLVVTQLMMAAPALLLGGLAVSGSVQLWHAYVLAFLFGVGTAFDAPARQSFVVEMVGTDDLANAVGLNSASFNSARIVGPAIAGFTIAALGSGVEATGWAILANGISYFAVIASLMRLDPRDLTPSEPVARGPGGIREGVSYVRGRPDLMLVLATVFFVGTFGLNFQMTSALMATEVFDKGAHPRVRTVLAGAFVFSVLLIVVGMMPTYWSFAAMLPLVGLTALTMITTANATIQLTVRADMRGRVAALYMMIFMGGTPLGAPLIGVIGEVFGARWTLTGGGLITLAGLLVSLGLYLRSTGMRITSQPGDLWHPTAQTHN
jgi:MFS family permease